MKVFSISSDTVFSFLKNLMAQYKNYFSSSIAFNNSVKNPDHHQFKNTTKLSVRDWDTYKSKDYTERVLKGHF